MKSLGRLLITIVFGSMILAGVVYGVYRSNAPDPEAIAPVRLAAVPEQVGQRSVINVPFSVPIDRLRDEINSQIPNRILVINEKRQQCVNQEIDLLIVRPNLQIDCDIRGVIRKDGDLEIFGADGALQVRMPIKFRFDVEGLDGLARGIEQRVTGAIEVRATVTPSIKRNWDVAVKVEPNFRWTERAHTEILGMEIDFASQLRPEIEKALDKLKPELSKLLEQADIQRTVRHAWRDLQQPLRLASNPNVWLTVRPRNVQFSGFDIRRNQIKAQVALVVDTETSVGARPEVADVVDLPNLRPLSDELPTGFDVAVPVTVSYKLIQRALARAELGDRIVRAVDPDQYDLDLKKFDVYPSGGSLTVGFDFAADGPGVLADSEGRAYISAVPVVDWDARTLRLTQMQFASVANNAVVDAAIFLISQRPVMELAEESASISFADEFEFALGEVDSALSQDLGDGITLEGSLRRTNIGEIQFVEDGIRLVISLRGRLSIEVGS